MCQTCLLSSFAGDALTFSKNSTNSERVVGGEKFLTHSYPVVKRSVIQRKTSVQDNHATIHDNESDPPLFSDRLGVCFASAAINPDREISTVLAINCTLWVMVGVVDGGELGWLMGVFVAVEGDTNGG